MSGLGLVLANVGALCVVAGAVLRKRPGQERTARALLLAGIAALAVSIVLSGIAIARH